MTVLQSTAMMLMDSMSPIEHWLLFEIGLHQVWAVVCFTSCLEFWNSCSCGAIVTSFKGASRLAAM